MGRRTGAACSQAHFRTHLAGLRSSACWAPMQPVPALFSFPLHSFLQPAATSAATSSFLFFVPLGCLSLFFELVSVDLLRSKQPVVQRGLLAAWAAHLALRPASRRRCSLLWTQLRCRTVFGLITTRVWR